MRRHVTTVRLGAALCAVAMMAAACGGGGGGSEGKVSGPFDWKRYNGKELKIMMSQHPWQEAVTPLLPEFERLTGIKVKVEAMPEQQYRQKIQVEMTGRSKDIDVFMTAVQNEGAKFAKNGWYEALDDYVKDTSKTSPDYKFDDFSKGVLSGQTFNGKLSAVPIQLEVEMLFYNKKLFQSAGVQVPKTYDEMLDVAAKLDKKNGARAIALRGKGAATVTQFAPFVFAQGADWTDASKRKAAFATPEGIKAFEIYGKLARDYGPPGAINRSWEESLPLFQQGQVAMYADASTFVPKILDIKVSKVADDAGFAPMPAGPKGAVQVFNGWSVAMSPFSKNRNIAWHFIQWATSPEIVGKTTDRGIAGGRQSVKFGSAFPKEWVDTYTAAIGDARPQLPQVVEVGQVRDAIGAAVVAAIEGKPVEPAVKKAEEEFNRIVGAAG
jgi:multiple sugar transport system substrate-binding protein